jgi:lipopolysaccharide biosynthesis regulator YciM
MLHWQCPSCRRWSTVKRRLDVDGEIIDLSKTGTH